jgi:hypothetical protein
MTCNRDVARIRSVTKDGRASVQNDLILCLFREQIHPGGKFSDLYSAMCSSPRFCVVFLSPLTQVAS